MVCLVGCLTVSSPLLRENNSNFRYASFGGVGSGKTITLVRDCLMYHRDFPNNPIFSNIQLNTVKFNVVDSASVLFELNKPCYLLLDELWHLADSRKSMSLINDVLSMLLLRSRKKGWRVGFSEQFITQTDIRVRYITDLWAYPMMPYQRFVGEWYSSLVDEKLYTTDHLTEEAVFLRSRRYIGANFFEDFNSEDDPFTLNLGELKELWDRYLKDRGLKRR